MRDSTRPLHSRLAPRGRGGRPFRFDAVELSGALADVGVLVPLAFALVTVNGMAATSLFFGIGVAYVITGLVYRLPLPVQPLKVIAAIAVAQGLPGTLVSAAGWVMGAALLLIAITDSARRLGRLFTKPIIRGLQLGVGIMLVQSGLSLASRPEIVRSGPASLVHLGPATIPTNWLIAAAALAVLVWGAGRRRGAASLPAIVLGVPLALAVSGVVPESAALTLGLSLPAPSLPRLPDLATASLLLVLPQIPLTLGNATFGTADAARTYFGRDARQVTPRRLLTTTAAGGLVSSLFGGVPICHGSSGLTAHYKLGARTGTAPLLMGGVCLGLALLLDGGALGLLSLMPYPVLGMLLAFVGVQHGLLARDVRGLPDVCVAAVTALAGLAGGNLALGMAAGIILREAMVLSARLGVFGPRRLLPGAG